jgi:methenyltetrahydrofolate cyclohydrolase
MLSSLSVSEYADQLASKRPAPGGGSAAALAGALAVALGEMVGNFTVGKKKYAAVEAEVHPALEQLTGLRAQLLELVDADAEAYRGVGAAYGMPGDTDDEKKNRSEAIEAALKAAAEVPRQVVLKVEQALAALPVLLEKGNPNLVSDVGVAAKLGEAALECAWLNVEVNLALLEDRQHVARLRAEMKESLDAARKIASGLWDATVTRICK